MMKKKLTLVGIIVFIIMIPVFAYAEALTDEMPSEKADSITVDETTREILGISKDETVIRVYYGGFMYNFSLGKTIDEMFAENDAVNCVVYVYLRDGKTEYKTIVDGKAVVPEEKYCKSGEYFLELHDKYVDKLHTLEKDANITEVYYMEGHLGEAYIYYVSDKGDYLMYDPEKTAAEKEEYLLPVAEFQPYAQKICDERMFTAIGKGDISFTAPSGLAAYKISGYRWRNALLWGIPVVLIAGGLGVFVFSKKRKKEKPTTLK